MNLICRSGEVQAKHSSSLGLGKRISLQTYLTVKVLFSLPLSQLTWSVKNFLKLVGLNWVAPMLNTLFRLQRKLWVTILFGGLGGAIVPANGSIGTRA